MRIWILILGFKGLTTVLECLPFIQTTRVEILCVKIKLQNLMLWENDPVQGIWKSAQQTEMCRKISSPQIAANFFEASYSELREPFDFPSLIFGFTCKYSWFVCCLSVFCVVRSSYTFSVAIITIIFIIFFNRWSVCNFTEYVRRLDEILAQKIEKFTQLRGKTVLLTFFSASLLACCCVKHGALCSLDLKGQFFHLWTNPYFRSSLLSTRVRCARRLGITLIGEKKVGHKKEN